LFETPIKTRLDSKNEIFSDVASATAGMPPRLRLKKDEYVSSRKLKATLQSKMTVDENRQRGEVAGHVYRAYFMAGSLHSSVIIFLLFFMFAITEANYLAIDSFLAYASQDPNFSVSSFMLGYGLIALSFLILMFVRSFAFARFHVTAVQEIYDMLRSIFFQNFLCECRKS